MILSDITSIFFFYEAWENPDHFINFVSVVGCLGEEIAIHKMTKIA